MTIRLAPPITISEDDIDLLVRSMREVLEEAQTR
jgi:acetylornithine/succinyldiaminopimelate/putrescine aminotransferase